MSTFKTSCPHCGLELVGSIARVGSPTGSVASVQRAAREPVASRKPQKRTKPNLCAHGYHVDLKACPFCKERGRRSRKRSPRSR
jgi:hypothetical protein